MIDFESYTLGNGVKVPVMALGTALNDNEDEVIRTVRDAWEAGYRSFDTAAAYGNQKALGKAFRENGLKRDEFYLTSKVWNSDHGYQNTLDAFERTCEELQTDYLDEYLIHWPGFTKSYIDTWKALEELYRQKKVRVIGISNFMVHHMEPLLEAAEIKPMVNQLEVNPLFIPFEDIAFCEKHGIQVEAQRPIRIGDPYQYDILVKLAEKYGKKPMQIVIRWHLDRGIRPLPKTVHMERMKENLDVFDFHLTADDIAAVDSLNTGVRVSGQHPDEYFPVETNFEGT